MTPLYKMRYVVEVLTQSPDENISLESLAYNIQNGDDSGRFFLESSVEIPVDKIAEEILAQGTDVSFFYPDCEDMEIGDTVEVPEPGADDLWKNSFKGTIVEFKDEMAVVEDQDGNCWDVEMVRLELI